MPGMDANDMLDDFALEKLAREQFGAELDVDSVILRRAAVGGGAYATVFLTGKKQLYCYISGPARLLFGDVKKVIARMGLKAELYYPPKGHPQYFDDIAREKFRDVFPGRRDVHDEDLVFYRTLAPYSPALVQINEVRDGTIYCADHDARTGWRPAVKFTYRRIKTS